MPPGWSGRFPAVVSSHCTSSSCPKGVERRHPGRAACGLDHACQTDKGSVGLRYPSDPCRRRPAPKELDAIEVLRSAWSNLDVPFLTISEARAGGLHGPERLGQIETSPSIRSLGGSTSLPRDPVRVCAAVPRPARAPHVERIRGLAHDRDRAEERRLNLRARRSATITEVMDYLPRALRALASSAACSVARR